MNYKGFDKDLKCRGFQYEIGKEYETENAIACETGFHACEYPLDIFGYYNPAESRFCEVIQSGEISKKGDDSKVASTKIKIGTEVGIPCLVKASIEYITERANPTKSNHSRAKNKANSSTGNWSANSATGYRSVNISTGNESVNSSTGNESVNSSTGNWSANISTGDECNNYAGHETSIAVGWGTNNKCKGVLGAYIVCSEWEFDDDSEYHYKFIGAKMAQVDGKVIKADTFYTLKHGEFVEVD